MILDIKTYAQTLMEEIKKTVAGLKNTPHLTIVMVGNNSASEIYVRNKIKTCKSVGIGTDLLHLDETISEKELIEHIEKLSSSPTDGILVQSPLPKHIHAQTVFDAIDPQKDVDGFSSINTARLYSGDELGLTPGTPKGIMKIIEHYFAENKKNNTLE
jgi:methylenetetrahydrofolate dehydrogenase (NADP+)/methenyltetrahydrofolate cyclohydrolase